MDVSHGWSEPTIFPRCNHQQCSGDKKQSGALGKWEPGAVGDARLSVPKIRMTLGGEATKIAQERKEGTRGWAEIRGLTGTSSIWLGKWKPQGKSCRRSFGGGCPGLLAPHVSSAGGELGEGWDLHSSFATGSEAESGCRSGFPAQGGSLRLAMLSGR